MPAVELASIMHMIYLYSFLSSYDSHLVKCSVYIGAMARNAQSQFHSQRIPKEAASLESSISNSQYDGEGQSQKIQDEKFGLSEPIVYHYLEFDTAMPRPLYQILKFTHSAPEPPDLSQYQSPFEWSKARKDLSICLSCAATVLTAYTAGSYASGIDQMVAEWHVTRVATLAGITTFTIGFGIAPMALAPFSEINGRRPVFLVTGILYVLFQMCCAVTPTYGGMLACRFLAGCASSTFSTMVGGVVSDLYHKESRNVPMALFTGASLFGTGLGPLVSGFIAQRTTWRWIFGAHTIAVAILMLLMVIFFKETRGSVLLSRKAKELNKWYQAREDAGYFGFDMPTEEQGNTTVERVRWKVKSDEERASLRVMITTSLYRPFHMLFTEPIVFFFSLWISFSWSVLYCTFSAVPYIFTTVYGFSLEETGAVFAATMISSILMTFVSIYQEILASRFGKTLGSTPEDRLYFACVESAALPIGLFWLGWSAFSSIPWIVPALAVGFLTAGIFSIYLAVFNYLADSYHRYTSSALAAQSFCRNMMGGAFPLFTDLMFRKMGTGGASSLLGGIAALLTIVPWVLSFMGPKIRARSKIASELASR